METTAALDTALSQERVIFFLAVRMDLPSGIVRLLDGSGEVTWSQGTFIGDDAIFGTLESIENPNDGLDETSPVLTLTFLPDADADVALLASQNQQGSPVRIWLGALDVTTKSVVADPYLLFDGELDQPTINFDENMRSVDFECVSAFERLYEDDEGIRLNPGNHKDVWPGETGLDAITGIVRQVIWGPGDKITGSAPGSVGGGVGGGGGGGSSFVNAFLGLVRSH